MNDLSMYTQKENREENRDERTKKKNAHTHTMTFFWTETGTHTNFFIYQVMSLLSRILLC